MRIRKWLVASVATLVGLCGALALAQDAGPYVGAWKGTWEGGGAGGRFELNVTKGADGKLSGGVSVGQDAGDYVASFASATVEGGEFKARYSYTPDAQADILVSGKIAGGEFKGAWTMVAKGAGPEQSFAAGTWTVKK